jgi:hypothetical protein
MVMPKEGKPRIRDCTGRGGCVRSCGLRVSCFDANLGQGVNDDVLCFAISGSRHEMLAVSVISRAKAGR